MTCPLHSREELSGGRRRTKAKKVGSLPPPELLAAVDSARTQAELFAVMPLPEETSVVGVSIEIYSAGHWHEWDRSPSIEGAQIHARRLAASWGRERVRIVPLSRLTSHLTRIADLQAAIPEAAPPRLLGAEQGAGEEVDSRQPGSPPGSYSLKKPKQEQEQNLLPLSPSPGQPARDDLHSCSARAGAPSPLPLRRYVAVADRWGGSSSPMEAASVASAHQLAHELAASTGEPWRVYCLAQTDQGTTWSPDGAIYLPGDGRK